MINKNLIPLAAGSITIGLSPILSKAVTLSPTLIGFYRFFFGALAMGIVVLIQKETFDRKSFTKALPYILGAGAMFALDLWFWHRSIKSIGAGIATILANTQIFYVVGISWFFLKEKPKWIFYPGMFLAFTGITISSWSHIKFGVLDDKAMGVILGLLTGLSYAIVTFFMKKSTTIYQGSSSIPILGITAAAAFVSFIFSAFESNFALPVGKDLLYLIIYGGVIHCLGWMLIAGSISKVPLSIAGLLLLLQPVFATIVGNLIYLEPLGPFEALGLLLSLAGIYMASNSKK